MGMFDQKKYLTGENGEFSVGSTFRLHSAALGDIVKIKGQDRQECVLEVDKGDGETFMVFTSGQGIVNQIKRIDGNDSFPQWVRIVDQETASGGNRMHLLEPAEQPS